MSYAHALAEMDDRLARLTRQRDDARAQADNLGPLLDSATRLAARLGTELAAALSELRDLRRALAERTELIADLQAQLGGTDQ